MKDIAVYPKREMRLHDLYSSNCLCHPVDYVEGAVLIFSHNKLNVFDLPELLHWQTEYKERAQNGN